MVVVSEASFNAGAVADAVFGDVFRRDWTGCGFALIQYHRPVSSTDFRHDMISLQGELDRRLNGQRGMRLQFQSLARFDQQTTTKFHLDGGPDESILMLGYEPTPIQSAVALADYTRTAHGLGLTPQDFMDRHNPMFVSGEKLLANDIRTLDEFDGARFQIVLINNSRLPWMPDGSHSLGVLHQASILNPDPSQSRIINSTMLAVVPLDAAEVVTAVSK